MKELAGFIELALGEMLREVMSKEKETDTVASLS